MNVLQSAALKAPRLAADAVGMFNVITGVVVPFATDEDTSLPVVPRVSAATEVTVPVFAVAPVAIPSSLVLSAELITPAKLVVAISSVAVVPVELVTGTAVVVRVPCAKFVATLTCAPAAIPSSLVAYALVI